MSILMLQVDAYLLEIWIAPPLDGGISGEVSVTS